MTAPSAPFPLQHSSILFGESPLYRLLDSLMSEGVIASTDGLVAQRAVGANMSVDVAAGEAIVAFDTPYGGKRQLLWTATNSGTPGSPNSGDNWISTFTAAHGTNPRIDRVVATVQDATLDATGQRRQVFQVIAGTATAGADLVNLNGAAAVPANSVLLANVLIPAASSSIVTANIDTTSAVRPQSYVGLGRSPVGAAMVKLAESPGATIDFTSIDQGYRNLRLILSLRGTNATNTVAAQLRMNNDSGANYAYSVLVRSAGTVTDTQANGQTQGVLGDVTAASLTADIYSHMVIDIPHYTRVDMKKGWVASHSFPSAAGQSHSNDSRGLWSSTAAINRLTIIPSAGAWNSLCRAELYATT